MTSGTAHSFYHIRQMQHVSRSWSWCVHWDSHFGEEQRWWFTIGEHCVISNYSVAICHRMSPTLKSTGGGSLWGKIWGGRGWPMLTKFPRKSERNMGLCRVRKKSCRYAIWAQCTNVTDRQTDRPRNGNIDGNRWNRFSAKFPNETT